jgi:fucose permease
MGAIAVSIIGILLGPMYPTIAISHTARVLPHHLVNGTIGWISASGAAGSALIPCITGPMASKLGIESLQPLWSGSTDLKLFYLSLAVFFISPQVHSKFHSKITLVKC